MLFLNENDTTPNRTYGVFDCVQRIQSLVEPPWLDYNHPRQLQINKESPKKGIIEFIVFPPLIHFAITGTNDELKELIQILVDSDYLKTF